MRQKTSNISIKKQNEVEFIDNKLDALQRALGMLSTAKEFTLTVFNGDETNVIILCDNRLETSVIKKSIATQMYILENIEQSNH